MPKAISKATKRIRKWNPLRSLKSKRIPKGSYLEKIAYAKYRREKLLSPEALLKTVSFSDWRKTRRGAAKPRR